MAVSLPPASLQKAAEQLSRSFPGIGAVFLFGSHASGSIHPQSDIDLAIFLAPDPGESSRKIWLDDIIQYQGKLCEQLGTRTVDVTVLNRAPAWLQREILVTGHLLLEQMPEALARFKESWLRDHGDLSYRRREHHLERRRALRMRYLERQSMAPVDRIKVEGRLDYIRQVCRELDRELAVLTEEEFCSRWIYHAGITHLLQTAVEAMLDVINHIISRQGFPYSDVHGQNVLTLAREGVFSPAAAERYGKMIGFRNLVVHLYHELDPHQVYVMAARERGDFDSFIGEVMGYLDRLETAL